LNSSDPATTGSDETALSFVKGSFASIGGSDDNSDGLFGLLVDFDDFDNSAGNTTQVLMDIGGSSDGLSLVYGSGNVLTMKISANGISATANYTLTGAQIHSGMLEAVVVVDIDYSGSNDLITLYIDRVEVASAVATLASNDFVDNDASGFGMNGGSATGGWPSNEDSVVFTSGKINYDAGLWHSSFITDYETSADANIDSITAVPGTFDPDNGETAVVNVVGDAAVSNLSVHVFASDYATVIRNGLTLVEDSGTPGSYTTTWNGMNNSTPMVPSQIVAEGDYFLRVYDAANAIYIGPWGDITVGLVPVIGAPAFNSDPINEIDATEDAAHSSSIADNASDPDSDPMTFSRVSGPAWLSVATDGTLSGTPTNSNVGANAFTVRVEDGIDGADLAILNITVINTNDAPIFSSDPINEADASDGAAYSSSIADNASDPDGDSLTFAKVSGPAWLSVAADGTLSGTPGVANIGPNNFTVSVSDGNGGTDQAALTINVTAMPTVFSFVATEDATTKEGNPDAKTGGNSSLELRLVGTDFGRVDYLKFIVSGLSEPFSSTILKLYSETQNGQVDAVECTDTTWIEGDITWNTRPATGSPIGNAIAASSSWFQIDVTSYITGNGTYTIALETPVNTLGKLSSSEGTNPPVLEVATDAVNWCEAADLDGIPPVNLADFAILALNWLQTGNSLTGDIKPDESVNEIDLGVMAEYWLHDCQ
jgi:hypothetical protein